MIVVTGGIAQITAPTAGFTTYTAQALIEAVAREMNDRFAQGTAQGGSTTTVILPEPQGAGFWDEHWLSRLLAGANPTSYQAVSDWNSAYTATLRPLGVAWSASDGYRLTPFDPRRMLTSAQLVRGILDQAIDLVSPHLFYEIQNDDLVLVDNAPQEYSFRVLGGAESYIRRLRRVQYIVSGGTTYYDLGFELIGDGSRFLMKQTPPSGATVRLTGEGYLLRTNSGGTVIDALVNETDKVVIEDGCARLVVLHAVRILLTRRMISPRILAGLEGMSLEVVDRAIQESERAFAMPHVVLPLRAIY